MRRSLLFIPGNTPGMLQNATLFSADTLILDLEDAVAVTQKDSARILVSEYLKANTFPDIEISIRINGMDTDFYYPDLEAIISDKVDTIMLPKARLNDLVELSKILETLEKARDLTKTIKIIPIIELAISLLEVEEIVRLDRVDGILLGAEDLTNDMQVPRTEIGNEIAYPRARIAMAAISYKIDAIDTPYTNTNSEIGLQKDSKVALGYGFNAKACIHPNQVPVVNTVFSPSEEAIAEASKILDAAQVAKEKNVGVFSYNGKMVDKPIIERSEKTIARAKKFGLLS